MSFVYFDNLRYHRITIQSGGYYNKKFITDERTALTYELLEDYYLVTGDEEPELEPIGIYGLRHRRYLRQNKRCLYQYLFKAGKLDAH